MAKADASTRRRATPPLADEARAQREMPGKHNGESGTVENGEHTGERRVDQGNGIGERRTELSVIAALAATAHQLFGQLADDGVDNGTARTTLTSMISSKTAPAHEPREALEARLRSLLLALRPADVDLQTAVQKVLAEHARHLPDGGKVAHAINAGNVQNALPDVQLQVQNVLVDKEPRIQPDSPPLPPSTGTFYLEIAESPHISIGIFLMLKGARLPLHDHPHMNVYSRVLFGRVQTTSYDWVGDDWVEEDHVTAEGTGMKSNTSGKDTKIAPKRKLMRLARRSGGGVATAEPATVEVVRPGEGNLHEIEALTMAAFIDVIGPPYNDGDRTCTYYRLGAAADPAHDHLWLHHDQPDFYCEHILYTGPRIDERLLA